MVWPSAVWATCCPCTVICCPFKIGEQTHNHTDSEGMLMVINIHDSKFSQDSVGMSLTWFWPAVMAACGCWMMICWAWPCWPCNCNVCPPCSWICPGCTSWIYKATETTMMGTKRYTHWGRAGIIEPLALPAVGSVLQTLVLAWWSGPGHLAWPAPWWAARRRWWAAHHSPAPWGAGLVPAKRDKL